MQTAATAPALAGQTIGSQAGDGFIIAEWADAGGHAGERFLIAPLHVHHKDDEAWYVLEGVLSVQVGDHDVEASAGSAVFVPRGTPHTYWNPAPGPVRYLLIMTPRIHQLIQAIHQMPSRDRDPLAALFRKHESELL